AAFSSSLSPKRSASCTRCCVARGSTAAAPSAPGATSSAHKRREPEPIQPVLVMRCLRDGLPFIGEYLAQNEARRAAAKRAPQAGALSTIQQGLGTRAARNSRHAATILRPTIFGRLRADRMFLAIGDRFHTRGGDA